MGPSILLCPSSCTAHLWRQVAPSIPPKQKESSFSLSSRCFAGAGDLRLHFLHSSSPSENCKKYFPWRRVSAASEISIEAVSAEEDVAQSLADGEMNGANAEQSIDDADEVRVGEIETRAEVTSNDDNFPTTNSLARISSSDVIPSSTKKTQARRTLNKSDSKKDIVVSPAELVPGAQFAGKVVSIQKFGAFVSFGAFTNGLAHISRLSKNFVKKVEDVVQVGQDVKVQILDVDFEANRISLMLVGEEEEESKKDEVDKEGGVLPERSSQQQTRAPRRDFPKRTLAQKNMVTPTLKKGEIVVGTVKNMIKSGVFLSLPDGTDGYLPVQEAIFKVPNTGLEAQFQVGEEVTVRVLRIERGRLSLTMKREANFDKLNEDLNKGVIGMATNPFELAFRRNEMIAGFLAERDKQKVQAESVVESKKEAVVATM